VPTGKVRQRMTGRRPHLDLAPERCDQCGRCLQACPKSTLKVGPSYIYVDWSACEGCIACAEACDRGAITVKGVVRRTVEPVRHEGAVFVVESVPAEVRPSGTWRVWEMAAVVAVMLALLALKGVLVDSVSTGSLSTSGSIVLRTVAQMGYYAILLGALAWLAYRRGLGFREAFGLTRFSWLSSAGWVIAALFALRLLSTLYGAVVQAIGWEPPVRAATDLSAWFGNDVLGLVSGMAAVVRLGPLVEESVFRGMLLTGLRGYVGGRAAVFASALLFAVSHLTLWAFVPLVLLGTALGWLTLSKGSVWPAVALHSLYNAVAVLAAFYVSGAVGV
jgi:membrane protease YdiL (CAAX protease family)/NAD-dependent dihydropyrimidine dehydrogenase PreA subunit